ncbi:MAG: beta-phosphoglucomutase [Gilvibacter sp.]
MNKPALIFDLDGVIVDTAHFHYNSWKKTAQVFGYDLTKQQNESLKGVSRKRSLEKILEWANKSISAESFESIMESKNQDYLAQVATMNKKDILPGVVDFLKIAKQAGCKMALGSASKNARTILQKVDLLHYFDAIVDGTNVSKAKPDPEVFIQGAFLLDAKHEDCIVFEDSVAGVTAANSAGMIAIGIGEQDVLSHAHVVYNGFTQITLTDLTKIKRTSSI